MPGGGAVKRSHALAIRCAKLRREGFTLTEISEITRVNRGSVAKRIQLGERLLSI